MGNSRIFKIGLSLAITGAVFLLTGITIAVIGHLQYGPSLATAPRDLIIAFLATIGLAFITLVPSSVLGSIYLHGFDGGL
jgi:hypothetical protein